MAEVDTHEVRRLRAEIARLQAAVDALAKVAGLFYTAGRADGGAGAHAAPKRKRPPRDPNRDRTHLYVVRALIIACLGVAVLMAGPIPVFSVDRQYRSPGFQAHILRAEPRPPGRRWQDYHFVTPAHQCPANAKLEACELVQAEARMAAEDAGLCAGPSQLPDIGEPRVEGVEAREKEGESALGVVGDRGLDLLALLGQCAELSSQPRRVRQAPGGAGGVVQTFHNAGRYVPVEQSQVAEHFAAAVAQASVPRGHVNRLRGPSRCVRGQHLKAAPAHPAHRQAGQQVLACVVPRRQHAAVGREERGRRFPLAAVEEGVPCCS